MTCVCNSQYRGTGSATVNTYQAYPVNFTQAGSQVFGSGLMQFLYQWQSSDGVPADIANCSVGEVVTYPGPLNQNYYWPSPPWDSNYYSINPTFLPLPGNNPVCNNQNGLSGVPPCMLDGNPAGKFTPPYAANGFTAQQRFWYTCPGINNGGIVYLTTNIPIVRNVTQSGSTFTYAGSKSGTNVTCILGATCTSQ
jgi:hypothetical protein